MRGLNRKEKGLALGDLPVHKSKIVAFAFLTLMLSFLSNCARVEVHTRVGEHGRQTIAVVAPDHTPILCQLHRVQRVSSEGLLDEAPMHITVLSPESIYL